MTAVENKKDSKKILLQIRSLLILAPLGILWLIQRSQIDDLMDWIFVGISVLYLLFCNYMAYREVKKLYALVEEQK